MSQPFIDTIFYHVKLQYYPCFKLSPILPTYKYINKVIWMCMYFSEQEYVRHTDLFSAHFLEMCTQDMLISCVDRNHQYAELVHEVFRVNQQLITHVHTCEKELIG